MSSMQLLSKALLYLRHVDLVSGELTNLESRYVASHHDAAAGTALDDDLRLVGGRSRFISGLEVHCVFQLTTIGRDLEGRQIERMEDI